uniref:Uncharacterized protein n=1 Tax=Ciona intestinalis TaxID=7719 RepID=H2XZB9_CIOIN
TIHPCIVSYLYSNTPFTILFKVHSIKYHSVTFLVKKLYVYYLTVLLLFYKKNFTVRIKVKMFCVSFIYLFSI